MITGSPIFRQDGDEEEDEEPEEEASKEIIATARRQNLLGRCIFLFLTQGVLAMLVGHEIIFSEDSDWYAYADSVWIVFARFMCGIVLHMDLSGEL